MKFLSYDIIAELLILGERPKGVFRPSVRTIPYSQVTGALRYYLNNNQLHAAGFFTKEPKIELMIFSPREEVSNISKIPMFIEVLKHPVGKVVISNYGSVESLPSEFTISLGGMKSKGYGRCRLFNKNEIKIEESKGKLKTRIPISILPRFGITFKEKSKILYGYLPISQGFDNPPVYEKSIFEGSEVNGPNVLIIEGE